MATPLKSERAARPSKRRAPSLDQLRAARTVWCTMPSGHEFLVRPPNMELHALSGGLPSKLRRLSGVNAAELNRTLASEGEGDEALAETRDYLVSVVRLMVVEPDLSALSWEEIDAVLLPEDFHFLLELGQRERSYDALGRRLWGLEPLDRWATFRTLHGCAEDCPACLELQRRVSLAAAE